MHRDGFIAADVGSIVFFRYLPQPELLSFCSDHGIHVMAHQPLGGRPVAVVNPNMDRPGPLVDSDVSLYKRRQAKLKDHTGLISTTTNIDPRNRTAV
jgi:hypothetical protein